MDIAFEPNKKLDQYFLKNQKMLDLEVKSAELKNDDIVLEVGAGIGNLTERIAVHCKVIAIEKDGRFIDALKKIENAEIVHGDALRIIKNLKFNKIISNIPYSLSQKLILEFLKKEWSVAVIIVQKEFAIKMKENTKLGMLIQDCAVMEIIKEIPGDDFTPKAVDSTMIGLKQKKIMDEKFWKFLSRIYRQKNRNVKNVVECDEKYAKKKIHQLTLSELKEIYKNFCRDE
jgi:16S rRNA (adenine1518-N6/adenine1519-N6)-dimethyltransferase